MSSFKFPTDEDGYGNVSSFSFPSSAEHTNPNPNSSHPNGSMQYQYQVMDSSNSYNEPQSGHIDLDEIQAQPTEQLSFNQIEIPDFDETPKASHFKQISDINNDFDGNISSSTLAKSSNGANTSSSNNIAGFSFPLKTDKAPSRMGSTRQQKPESKKSTTSSSEVRKMLTTELKTASEYTLHMIFTQFVRLSERKLDAPETMENELSDKFLQSLQPGADPLFDKVVTSLGYIAKKQLSSVVESVMYWRISKNEQVEASINAYNKNKHLYMLKQKQVKGSSHSSSSSGKMSLHSRNTSSQSTSASISLNFKIPGSSGSNSSDQNSPEAMSLQYLESQMESTRQAFVHTENKANAAAFLVCRVLIEVVKQISMSSVNLQFYNTLEENIYNQLKSLDPAQVLGNKVKLLNWTCLTELIGEISVKRFSRISDKFIADLEKTPTAVSRTSEQYVAILIRGMRKLRLTNYPLEEFEESCGFLSSLAKFFYKTNNSMLINSYCETLSELLLPLCGVLNAETDLPVWIDVIKLMLKKINTIIDKPKYWDNAFTLMCVCLSVSPASIFYENWFDLIEYNLSNKLYKASAALKDGGEYLQFSASINGKRLTQWLTINCSRVTLVKSLSRLVWTYIFRCTESLNKTTKKLDSLFKLLFFNPNTKKQQWLSYDSELLKPVVILLRAIGFSNVNYTMESLLLPLIKQSFPVPSIESLSPEKLLVVLKAYILMLDDMISNTRPPYPTNEQIDAALETPPLNFNTTNIREALNMKNVDQSDILYHEEISNHFCKLFLLLDSEIGGSLTNSQSTLSNGTGTSNDLYSNMSTTSPSFLPSKSQFLSFSFNSDSNQQVTKKLLSIDLFEKMIESIPWFYQLSQVIPYKKLIECLTRNALHENQKIANASVSTLKKLCSKKNSGVLISTFAKYAFSFTEDITSKAKSNILTSSSANYEKLLKIYLELLVSWLDFLKSLTSPDNSKTKKDGDDFYILNGNFKMNMTNTKTGKEGSETADDSTKDLNVSSIITTIEQVEGNGLFFLCSRSTSIRRCAVAILKIVPKFDEVVKANVDVRLIRILETALFFDLIGSLKLQLSMPERKKLTHLKSKNRNDLLVKLAEADYGVELTLWFKVFPKVLSIIFERSPVTMALCRSTVCVRLIQMHEYIVEFAESKPKSNQQGSSTKIAFNPSNSGFDIQPEVIIEQWKLFLIVACTSLTSTSNQELPHKLGGGSGVIPRGGSYSINSAKSVFKLVIPLLRTEQPLVTDAIHSGLSCININIFKALVEVIQPIRLNWETEIKAGSVNESNMRIRIEVTRILHATSKFLSEESIYSDSRILMEMIMFVKTVRSFLGASAVQESFTYQKLRRYFCGLLENVFSGVQKTKNPDHFFPFEARSGCFTFLEEWCGYGESAGIAKKRYHIMKKNKRHINNPAFSAAMELESTALEYSAVSSMATLCSGAINQTVKGDKAYVVMAIDYKSLISWIKALFATDDDIIHRLGRRALKNLLAFNKEKTIFDQAAKEFYSSSSQDSKTAQSYFVTICDAILDNMDYNCEAYEILVFALCGSQSASLETRKMAGKLLVYIEKRFFSANTVEGLMDGVASTAKFVYKRAASDLSRSFALKYGKEKYYVISLFSLNLYKVGEDCRADLLELMQPWLESIKLSKLESDSRYNLSPNRDAYTEMVLNNMIEITEKLGISYERQVQSLWISLVKGNPEVNSKVILDYLFLICLQKRSVALVELCKQIITYVYVSYHAVIDTIIQSINPKAMIPPDVKPMEMLKNSKRLPYIYSLPDVHVRDMFSLGQVAMIFLVDLLRANTTKNDVVINNLPMLLNIAFVLLDHYLPVVRQHAIELLCTVIHEMAFDNETTRTTIENLKKNDPKLVWSYDDLNNDRNGARTPKNMDSLIRDVLSILAPQISTLQQNWSRTTLVWATSCSVRHIACRSFQAFRSLLSFLDKIMLRDMLHRLSNTISDGAADIQGFAMQILMSLNAITAELSAEQLISFPELFWSAVACLHTIHEKEFIEVISIISKFISKIDLNSMDTISCLISTFPPNWEGKFEGLQSVVMIGLRSSNAWDPSLKLLDRLNKLQSSDVIAGNSRLLLALLSNMPRFLHALEVQDFTPEIKEAANILSDMALAENYPAVSRIVISLANNKFRKKEDFIMQSLSFIKQNFFPEYQSQCLVFLLGLLMNKIKWVKLETLELLKCLFPMIDLTREEFQGVGADLLSPVLRLLLTEYSEKALEVLDETDNISGSQLDKDFIRLSLGNRTLRKEYEKIATLFGVPDESGWSIPMSAVTAATTRNNVHAVYLTCRSGVTMVDGQQQGAKQDAEFHDDKEEPVKFYDEHPEKRSISNMYATLNYFESFFEAEGENPKHKGEEVPYHDRTYSNETSKFSTIINDNLDRTDSNGSYRLDPYNSNNYNNYINYGN